jgi:hypothetical protein
MITLRRPRTLAIHVTWTEGTAQIDSMAKVERSRSTKIAVPHKSAVVLHICTEMTIFESCLW